MKTIPSLLIAALFATLTFAVWAYLNRPTREPPWPARIQGFAFSPFRANEDPTHLQMPTDAEIDSDLALLPYASALLVSLASAFPLPARLLGTDYRAIKASGKRAETDPAS
jgi:hypothetical protein